MKPRFRRLACAGAATVGAAVTAFVLAGGPTASADQCGSAQAAGAVAERLAVECPAAAQAAGAAVEGRPGARIAAPTPNEASPPPEESAGEAVEPGASNGPEVPETPEGNPVEPETSAPPQVPETTPPAEESTPPGVPQVPAESPPPSGQPQVPTGGTTPETGQSQPALPVTGSDDGAKIAGLGAGLLAAGAALVAATRRRRTN